jgi:hypothetical protein
MKTKAPKWSSGVLVVVLAGCGVGGGGGSTGTQAKALEAVCVAQPAEVPMGGWVCGQDRTLECDTHEGANPDRIHVVAPDAQADAGVPACPAEPLSVNDPGPYPPGTHRIEVRRGDEPTPICASTLTVVDTQPPIGLSGTVSLWPPNHKEHEVAIDDCVTISDACDPDVRVFFTFAATSEADDATGDGHTSGDIAEVKCDKVKLRAERSGPGAGRVYTLGWKAVDHSGNASEGVCHVVVPHDQGHDLPDIDNAPQLGRVDREGDDCFPRDDEGGAPDRDDRADEAPAP